MVSGLKNTFTGDTLVDAAHAGEAELIDLQPLLRVPDPVFFCSIEAESASQQQALEDALAVIQMEDPSVKVGIVSSSSGSKNYFCLNLSFFFWVLIFS